MNYECKMNSAFIIEADEGPELNGAIHRTLPFDVPRMRRLGVGLSAGKRGRGFLRGIYLFFVNRWVRMFVKVNGWSKML